MDIADLHDLEEVFPKSYVIFLTALVVGDMAISHVS